MFIYVCFVCLFTGPPGRRQKRTITHVKSKEILHNTLSFVPTDSYSILHYIILSLFDVWLQSYYLDISRRSMITCMWGFLTAKIGIKLLSLCLPPALLCSMFSIVLNRDRKRSIARQHCYLESSYKSRKFQHKTRKKFDFFWKVFLKIWNASGKSRRLPESSRKIYINC